jgi:hypothetical protein
MVQTKGPGAQVALVMEMDTGLRLTPCARMNEQHGPQVTS